MKLRRQAAVLGICAVAVSGIGVAASPVASADSTGGGTTSPSHDSGLAVIPLCNPANAARWLDVNFSDHGRDIDNYEFTVSTPFEVFQYAGADARFHIPATIAALGGFSDPARYCTVAYDPREGS